ncbi:hypothetical protein Pla22_05300 [Rubripirellula amarantea]|uniref:DUF1583 domain-containing protein n=1 Tax=Rubripirellula amarantea TaxID=2527999 RepID=A0A5C5WSW2_9BACT|nr:hypothetical protein [Rubripirellula amarantea]TWT52902.1 hypothetical protein Pla22_05300 [Rubripirellula amarantea]
MCWIAKYRSTFLASLWFTWCVFTSTPGVGIASDLPDADEINRESWARDYFYGKKFRYEVKITDHADTEQSSLYAGLDEIAYQGTRELVIGRPNRPGGFAPIRVIHFQKNQGEPHTDEDPLMTYFNGSDGKESRIFERRLLTNFAGQGNGLSYGRVHVAFAIYVLSDDPFLNALTPAVSKFVGIESSESRPSVKDDFSITLVKHVADRDAMEFTPKLAELTNLAERTERANMQYVVSSWPEYLTLESWDRNINPPNTRATGLSVTELKTHGDHRYPEKGKRVTHFQSQEFRLLEITDLSDSELASFEWFPPWPTGTSIFVEAELKRKEIPFTSEERKKIRARSVENTQSKVEAAKVPYFWMNVVLVTIIIALFLLRSWRQEQAHA